MTKLQFENKNNATVYATANSKEGILQSIKRFHKYNENKNLEIPFIFRPL